MAKNKPIGAGAQAAPAIASSIDLCESGRSNAVLFGRLLSSESSAAARDLHADGTLKLAWSYLVQPNLVRIA
jgi:hypothetical protein